MIEILHQIINEFKQLHIWLIRYRVLAVAVCCFCCWLCLDSWLFYKAHYEDYKNMDASAGLLPFIVAYLGGVKWSLDNVTKKHEGHGE